jgi:hypothetical protein
MIPMRDGVRLYTDIIVPKGAKDAPIVLTRTKCSPYWSGQRSSRAAREAPCDRDMAGNQSVRYKAGGRAHVYPERGKQILTDLDFRYASEHAPNGLYKYRHFESGDSGDNKFYR